MKFSNKLNDIEGVVLSRIRTNSRVHDYSYMLLIASTWVVISIIECIDYLCTCSPFVSEGGTLLERIIGAAFFAATLGGILSLTLIMAPSLLLLFMAKKYEDGNNADIFYKKVIPCMYIFLVIQDFLRGGVYAIMNGGIPVFRISNLLAVIVLLAVIYGCKNKGERGNIFILIFCWVEILRYLGSLFSCVVGYGSSVFRDGINIFSSSSGILNIVIQCIICINMMFIYKRLQVFGCRKEVILDAFMTASRLATHEDKDYSI